MSFSLTSGGSIIQNNQNLMVGSEFSNCIWGEVNDGWGIVNEFFRGRRNISLPTYFCSSSVK